MEQEYFPGLEQCFSGESQLMTWAEASRRLLIGPSSRDDNALIDFLGLEQSATLLNSAQSGFPKPSCKARSEFETKTAAINIPASSNGQYNIEQVKQDTLCLSRDADIDEVAALRIAVQEWQQRPTLRLKSGFSEAEQANLRDVTGDGTAGTGITSSEAAPADFDSSQQRRVRLLLLYLGERKGLLATSHFMHQLAFVQSDAPAQPQPTQKSSSNGTGNAEPTHAGDQSRSNEQNEGGSQAEVELHFENLVNNIQLRIENLDNGSGWVAGRDDIQDAWTVTNLQEIDLLINIALIHIRSHRFVPTSGPVISWLRLSARFDFFANFPTQSIEQAELVTSLQRSVAILSLALFDVTNSLAAIVLPAEEPRTDQSSAHSPFFFECSNVSEIHEIMTHAASTCSAEASPTVFAWGLILYTIRELGLVAKETREGHHVQRAIDHSAPRGSPSDRRSSASSVEPSQQTIYEDIMDNIRVVSMADDPVEYLMNSAVTGSRVFDIIAALCTVSYKNDSTYAGWKISIFQDLVAAALEPLGYCPEILTAQMAILSTSGRGASIDDDRIDSKFDAATRFLSDDFLMEQVFGIAQARFPYEALPFLHLCQLLLSAPLMTEEQAAVVSQLRQLSTFTQAMPNTFSSYHTIREDENANLVSLDTSLGIFSPSSRELIEYKSPEDSATAVYQLPRGTTGQVVSEDKPIVIMWYYKYSGLTFLGRWLETYLLRPDQATLSADSPEVVASETLVLLASLLHASSTRTSLPAQSEQRAEESKAILEELSNGLAGGSDVISIIFEIFEQEMQRLKYRRVGERSLDVILACVKFIHALVDFHPGRVFSALFRSSFVDLHGRNPMLTTLVNAIEVPSGEYPLLEAVIGLYDSLIEDAITNAVKRACQKPDQGRINGATFDDQSVPKHFISETLHAMTRSLSDVLELCQNWKFNSLIQRTNIQARLCRNFEKILTYAYGAGDCSDRSQSPSAILLPSAAVVLETLSTSPNARLRFPVVLQTSLANLKSSDAVAEPRLTNALVEQAAYSLSLFTCVARAQRVLGVQSSLQPQLLDMFPILIRLLTSDISLQLPVLQLMRELLEGSSSQESKSLLGHLGSDTSRQFLNVMSFLGNATTELLTFEVAWKVLTSLISAHQQWFAVCILTGSPPRPPKKDVEDPLSSQQPPHVRGKPILERALQMLSATEVLDKPRAVVLLAFLIQAQENWSWATGSLYSHPQFFTSITANVSKMENSNADTLNRSLHNTIVSLTTDLSTAYLHHARSVRDAVVLKKMIPVIAWLTANAIDVSAYNVSLQSTLRKNFELRFSPCALSDFKKSELEPREYGGEYFYDITLGGKVLSFDSSWLGRGKSTDEGFLGEFKRANLNLSLVESQIQLLHSFKALAVEHCAYFAQDREVQRMMAHVVQGCLHANTRVYPNEKLFEDIFQTRIDLALALSQRLVYIKARGGEYIALLSALWEAMRFRNASYESAITNDDLIYYRSMLTLLLLTMQFHVEKRIIPQSPGPAAPPDPSAPLIAEIASTVVGKGLVSLANAVHDQTQQANSAEQKPDTHVGPKDMHLLLSIWQTILRLPLLPQVVEQISASFCHTGVTQSCLQLYSWSHVLMRNPKSERGSANLPVYAELTLKILSGLCALHPVAEDLAVEGVLTSLSTSRMTQILRSCPGGVSFFDERGPQHQLLFTVWSEGILPLCINLLHSVGRPLAGEIAAFVNQFPSQLAKASTNFSYTSPLKTRPGNLRQGAISLASAQEATRLALISHITAEYRLAGASAGVDAMEIPELVAYDQHKKALAEDIEEVVESAGALGARIVALDDREDAMLKTGELERKIREELKSTLVCLKGFEE